MFEECDLSVIIMARRVQAMLGVLFKAIVYRNARICFFARVKCSLAAKAATHNPHKS